MKAGASPTSWGGRCPTCNAKMVKYRHALSIPLLTGLRSLHRAGGGPLNIKELGFTHYQWCNFQKLQYWGFVRKVAVDGEHRKGFWAVTEEGRAFLYGKTLAPQHAWSYRARACPAPEDVPPAQMVTVRGVTGWYERPDDYSGSARPVDPGDGGPSQGDFFR